MTHPQAPPAAPPEPPRYAPPPGSRIEDLMDRLETAKAVKRDAEAKVTEADELVRTIKAAIAVEVTAAIPGAKEAVIEGSAIRPAFRLKWITPTKVNRERLKTDYPEAYGACLEWGTPYWDLRKAGR